MISLPEAARRLGVEQATLRHQRRNGRIKGTQLGRDWYFEEEEVERYARESRDPSRSGPRKRRSVEG